MGSLLGAAGSRNFEMCVVVCVSEVLNTEDGKEGKGRKETQTTGKKKEGREGEEKKGGKGEVKKRGKEEKTRRKGKKIKERNMAGPAGPPPAGAPWRGGKVELCCACGRET